MQKKVLLAAANTGPTVTKSQLEGLGYEVYYTNDGEVAWKIYREKRIDICLLDIAIANLNAITLIRKIRHKDDHTPVILLTERDDNDEGYRGLEAGADSYIVKGTSLQEIHSRIKVFFKRNYAQSGTRKKAYKIGNSLFELPSYTITRNKTSFSLPKKEGKLLEILVLSKNRPVDRKNIIKFVWGEVDDRKQRSLEGLIYRLRIRFKKDPSLEIETVHGIGYKLLVFGGNE